MDKIVIYIIFIFFVLGAMDAIFGNKLGLGSKFEDGIKAMGPLAFGMIGIYSLSPLIANFINKTEFKIIEKIGIDLSVIPTSILAIDMGGYSVAEQVSKSHELLIFSGVIIASNLGSTISFSIPVAIGMIDKKHHEDFSSGILTGIVALPIGIIAGGLALRLSIWTVIINTLPVIFISSITALMLIYKRELTLKIFDKIGKVIMAVGVMGMVLQGTELIMNITILPDLMDFKEVIFVVGKIGFVLAGAYPMLECMNKVFKKGFNKIGEKLNVNKDSVASIIGNFASNLLVFSNYDKMDKKGRVMSTSLAVTSAFMIGGQLGFVAGVESKAVIPFIISKIVGGIAAIYIVNVMYKEKKGVVRNYGGKRKNKIIES